MAVNNSYQLKRIRGPSFGRFMFGCLFVFTIFASCLIVMAMIDEEAYYLLLNNTKDSFGAFMGSFTEGFHSGTVNSNNGDEYETITLTSTGLNLDLIDRIPDVSDGAVGYVKELLSLYRNAQNGKVYKGYNVAVTTLLGMHTDEHSMINSSIGKVPRFYFKPDDWKQNVAHRCILDYTSKSYNVVGNPGGVSEASNAKGIFQAYSLNVTKSDMDPYSVGRGYSPGDVRFLPDGIAKACSNFSEFIKDRCKNKQSLTDDEISIILGPCNNRGGNGTANFSLGIVELGDGASVSTGKKGKIDKRAATNTIGIVVDMLKTYLGKAKNANADAIAEFDDPRSRAGFVLLALFNSDGHWFIDSQCYSYLTGSGWSSTKGAYKSLYPDKYHNDKDGSDLKRKLNDMQCETIAKSITKATGDSSVTDSDCSNVYGAASYSSGAYRSGTTAHGSVWHVSSERDNGVAYRYTYSEGKKPYYIFSFDCTGSGYWFNCGIKGYFLYAKLLKQCGVNSVDPTNPSTYIGTVTITMKKQITSEVTAPAAQQWSGELDSIYKKAKIDQTKLTPDRIAVLNVAADMAYHKPCYYGWGKRGLWQNDTTYGGEGWQMDCANFTFFCYYFAGFKYKDDILCYTTSQYPGEFYDRIGTIGARSQKTLPGDVVWHSGHVEIFLSFEGTGNNMWVIGAHGEQSSTYRRNPDIQIDMKLRNDMHTTYRLKVIDQDKRGEPKEIPRKGKSGEYIAGFYPEG